ncbi:MAG: TlpA disulfide reductase family protein, partial [Thioalkalispiraceae bacterium]
MSLLPKPLYLSALFILVTMLTGMVFSISAQAQPQPRDKSIELTSGEEISATIYGQHQQVRVLWLSSSSGFHVRHHQVATDMANKEMEVWQVNLAESLFMPKGAETMRNIPPAIVAELIEEISEQGKYRILMMSSGYGSIPVLRGIHAWQSRQRKQAVIEGAILFTPYVYTTVPELGMAPSLIPELSVTNIPLYIFQAEKNGNRWHLPDMLNALEKHAPVFTQILSGVTSLYYPDDKAAATLARLERVATDIQSAASRLRKYPVPFSAVPLKAPVKAAQGSGLNTGLTSYKGTVIPTPIALKDVNNKPVVINSYKGKVTLINFWASWCPPCVEEIPSLNRLKQAMQDKPFQLISINYAESRPQVHNFMQQVAVDFPVLIDPQGQLAGKWKV